MAENRTQVCIVGGGPVGLLTALRLGQAGVDTIVLEAHETVLPATRAVVYMPVVIPVLTKLGIIDVVKRQAYLNRDGITWRDIDGNGLANLPLGEKSSDEFGGVLLLGQYKLAMLILDELKQYPCVEVRFGMRCVGIQPHLEDSRVTIVAEPRRTTNSQSIIEAQYVLGTDGANSVVRRLLNIDFEGFTYSDWKMIGTDILFDFVGELGYTPLNFVVDSQDWAVIAYTGQDGEGDLPGTGIPQYRVAYSEPPNLPNDPADYMRRAQDRLPRWTRGKTNFRILRAEPYTNSQRVAQSAMNGRVMLAGDALHSNNPIGGLGLTGGICDAFCYGNALVRVIKHNESDNLLAECAATRRQTWVDTTDKLSQANIARLYAFDDQSVREREQFFRRLNSEPGFAEVVRAGMGRIMQQTFE